MKVSVIVPTFNGAHKLTNVLQSLLDQEVQDFELIVVVDGSTDDTAAVLNTWLPKFKHAKSIYQSNGGRSGVRNAGAKLAVAELLYFVDDDMRLEPDCLEQHIRHHQKITNSLVSGAQLYDEKKATTDFQRYKCLISKNWCKDIQNIYPEPLSKEKLHLTAANFSVPKELFLQLGMFDESVKDMEDFLLAYTAAQTNIPVYYLHNAIGWHDDFSDIFSMQERYFQYRKTALQVAVRFPELPDIYPRYAPRRLTVFKKMVLTILTKKRVIAFIQNNIVLPENIRYRLYGAIIHAKEQLTGNV